MLMTKRRTGKSGKEEKAQVGAKPGARAAVCVTILALALALAFFIPEPAKADWWNSAYPYRFKIVENKTTMQVISLNDTFGVNGSVIWALTDNQSYLYTTRIGEGINKSAVGTQVSQNYWQNESASMLAPEGYNIHQLWDDTGNATSVWHLGETYANDSLLRNNCTIGGGTPVLNNTKTKFGTGVSFDGSSFLNCTMNDSLMNLVRDFTITAWVKTACNAAGCGYGMINAIPTGALTGGWQISASDIQWAFQAFDGAAVSAIYTEARNTDRWYFVVANNNGTHIRLFLNGTERIAAAMTTVGQAYTSFNLGWNARDNQFFTGTLDEVRVYNETKSDTWIWNEWLSGTNNMTRLNSSEINTFADTPRITPCSESATVEALVLHAKNETSDFTAVNATMEMRFDFNYNGTAYTYNYSTVNETYHLCIFPSYLNVTVDGSVEYGNATYQTRAYFFDDDRMDNVTDNLDLLMVLPAYTPKVVRFKVIDQYGTVQPNVIIRPQRWYWSTNQYKSVASILTDSTGQANTYLRLNDAYYRFLLMKDGVTLDTVAARTVADSGTTLIDIELTITPGELIKFPQYYGSIYGSCNYTNTTGNLTCTYNDESADQILDYAELTVMEYRGALNSSSVLYTATNTSIPNGTFIYHIGNESAYTYTHTYTLSGQVGDTRLDRFIMAMETLDFVNIGKALLFGNCLLASDVTRCGEGAVLAFFITLAAALLGAFNPSVGISLSLVGVMASSAVGLWAVTIYNLMGMVCVAAIIMWKMSKG